jgi:hypothetical protein
MIKIAFVYFKRDYEDHPIYINLKRRVVTKQYFYKDFLDSSLYDFCLLLPDGFDQAEKYFFDKILLNKDTNKYKFINEFPDPITQTYRLIEEFWNKNPDIPSILGCYQPHGNLEYFLTKDKKFGQVFDYFKPTLEEIKIKIKTEDALRHNAILSYNLYDTLSQKLLRVGKVSLSENYEKGFLKIPLQSPIFKCYGKQFLLSFNVLYATPNKSPIMYFNEDNCLFSRMDEKNKRNGAFIFMAF